MYKLEIEEKEYEFPSGWDEVTLDQLMYIQNCLKEPKSDLYLLIDLLSGIAGIDKEILYEIDIADLNKIDMTWISEKIEKQVKQFIEIDGVKYIVITDLKKLKLGEYADLDFYSKDVVNNMDKICAILIRPEVDGVIEKYDGSKMEARAKLFREKMKVNDILGISDFFLTSVVNL